MNRKRKRSVADVGNTASKKQNLITISDDSEFFNDDLEEDNTDEACVFENNNNLLIRLMYQVHLSVLCLLRKLKYNRKYPSLSLVFGDSKSNKFSDIIICNNDKSIHVKVQYIERHRTDNIADATLFTNDELESYILHCFRIFVACWISNLDSSLSRIKYFIIYSNLYLELNQENEQRILFYPFKFDKIDIDECKIVKDFLFTNDDKQESGFYKFSQDETKKIFLKRLKLSPAIRKVLQKIRISRDHNQYIAEEFLDKFILAVNQPNREVLNSIVKIERNGIITTDSYIVLQRKVLRNLRTSGNSRKPEKIPEIMHRFILLMSLQQDMFLYKNILSINYESNGMPFDLNINYKNKISYIKVYYSNSNINYNQLFSFYYPERQEKNSQFCINKYFTYFLQELEKGKDIGHFIVNSNTCPELSEKNIINKGQPKELCPLRFDKIDVQRKKYKIFNYCSCIDKNGLYQLSQEDKMKISGMLVIPPWFFTEKKEWLSNINVEEIREGFLNKLVFAFNQPTRKEMKRLIKKEIMNASNEIPYNFEELHEITLRCSESFVFSPIKKEMMENLLVDIRNNSKSLITNKFIEDEIKFDYSDVKKSQVNEIFETTVAGTHNSVSKKQETIIISDDSEFDSESEKNEADVAFIVAQNRPLILKLMYQVDFSVLCLLRKFEHSRRFPSLTLVFENSEKNNFSDVIIRYKFRSVHIRLEYVDRCCPDSVIGYETLFTKYKQGSYIDNCFNSFVEYQICNLNSSISNIEYFIIYTNSSLDLTPHNIFKPRKFKKLYPFRFQKKCIEENGIIKDLLFTNDDIQESIVYLFSQEKAVREELLKRLQFSSAVRQVIQKKKISLGFEKYIKEIFLDKLVFAVNRPNREELNSIVKHEIGNNYKIHDSYLSLHKKVLCDLMASANGLKTKKMTEIIHKFSLLMSLLQNMFIHKNISYVNYENNDMPYDFIVDYKDKISYIKVYYSDSNINYSQLFPVGTQERNDQFCINKHYTFFAQELGKGKNIGYYIIYNNADLESTEQNIFNNEKSGELHPLPFDKIDIQRKKFKIFKCCSCINEDGLYQLSQEKKIKVSNMLILPPGFLGDKEELLSQINEEEIRETFLNNLVFAFNQPSRKKLRRMIEKEIMNASNEIPYNFEELHEITLRLSEHQGLAPIKKEVMTKIYNEVTNVSRICLEMQNKVTNEVIQFAKCLTCSELSLSFSQFLEFLRKEEGIKYLEFLKKNDISLSIVSSILKESRSNSEKAFKDLINLWFDEQGNKTQYLTTLQKEGITLLEVSRFIRQSGVSAAKTFKELYKIWFDDDGNKTQYLKTLEKEGIDLYTMSVLLSGSRAKGAEAFKDLYNLWFDEKGNKTQYLKTLEKEEINLSSMTVFLSGSRAKAPAAFKGLYHLWFDSDGNKSQYLNTLKRQGIKLSCISSIIGYSGNSAPNVYKELFDLWFDTNGNKSQYLKTLEKEGISLNIISGILNGAKSKAVKAFKDLYDLWFDVEGNKSHYLKTLERKGINLSNMSSILTSAGAKAPKAFIDLFNLWFDKQGNKTQYLKNLEKEGMNLSDMSNFLGRAGVNAVAAFKSLYNLWFDKRGNKTDYLKALEKEDISLSKMSSIISGARAKAAKAFKELYDLWFDEQGNKKQCLQTLEKEGIKLSSMSSILGRAGVSAPKTFKELYSLWFDAKGNKTKHLKILENEGVDLSNVFRILKRASSKAAKAFKDLVHLWLDNQGNKTPYLSRLEKEGINLSNVSSILRGAGACAATAFKNLYSLWFDSEGNKTQYLKTLQKAGVKLANVSRIISGSGASAPKAFRDLYKIWFDAQGNKTQHLKTLEKEGIDLSDISSILYGAQSYAAQAFKELYYLLFDNQGNKTLYLKTLEKEGIKISSLSIVLSRAGANAARAFKELYNLWFDRKGKKRICLKILEREQINLSNIFTILFRAGANAARAFMDLYNLWFTEEGNKTLYLKTLEKEGIKLSSMSSIISGAGAGAPKAFKELHDLWFDVEGNKTEYLVTLEREGIHLSNVSNILHTAGTNAAKAFKDLYNLWFDADGNKTKYLIALEREGINLCNMSSFIHGVGVNAPKAFKHLYDLQCCRK